jgi:hypothetical protein
VGAILDFRARIYQYKFEVLELLSDLGSSYLKYIPISTIDCTLGAWPHKIRSSRLSTETRNTHAQVLLP